MAKILFGSFVEGLSSQYHVVNHIAGLLVAAGHTVDDRIATWGSSFDPDLFEVTDHDVVVWFAVPAFVVDGIKAADYFQSYNLPKIWFGADKLITSRYTEHPQVRTLIPAPGHTLVWWQNNHTPMTSGLGGTGYAAPGIGGILPNLESAIVAEATYWDLRAHLVEGNYSLLNAFETGYTVNSYTVPHRTVLHAGSIYIVPGNTLDNFNQGYFDCLNQSIAWVLEFVTNITGEGGWVFGGSATTEIVAQLPVGGLRLAGAADTLKIASGIILAEVTASGGLLFAGRSTTSRTSIDIRENERWSNVDAGLEETFLYGRLFNQRTPFVARDSGPHIIGNLLQGLAAEDYTLSYNPATGEFSINGELHFTQSGVAKVDLTFDDRGFPLIAYELDEAIWLYRWNHDLQDYEDVTIGAGTQPFICFYGTRINSTGEPVLIYLRGSQVVTRRGSENFERLYATSVVLPDNVRVRISGLGQTPTDRLQANLRAIYERKIE